MYTHRKQIVTAGVPADQAKKAMIMLHGRGASAVSILTLKDHLQLDDYAIFAPQATEHSWYPYSFMAPVSNNQPALDSALEMIGSLVEDIKQQGILQENIYFLGFSQGACLTLEYVTRNAGRYGGVIAFTGGLIGEKLMNENYQGDFNQTPILITTGDPDPHVPVSRVNETVSLIKKLNANVTLKIYKGRQHTVTAEELALANGILS
ncbi:phospholipase/carboxylesterase [Mucilaginibacter lappiensis]|uniref:Phospholipase/carboxylesterase n=1 Tax=Mucilaginibacter lappiensis TaxID=354630 RepID=A0ABR6PIK6_9SPHI|nr:dienelactone hydrolase family protein [Mucilaginibacter lappiensis]MBB6109049.1 phospholipase/carboxylesterase [Mucilaginibacter lappiensis]SIQ73537.1 phospholipase/carboxylesterase [Mucilaginibacter lappiensis]